MKWDCNLVFFLILQLTACAHGATALLFPMYWQHIFIPVLPPHLLDYCWYVWPPPARSHTSPGSSWWTFTPSPFPSTSWFAHTWHTHTHHAMCCCHAPSADAKACRCTCSHLPSLSLSRSHDRFSCVAPRCNERPGSPCSIFHAGANAALSSFKPSQGFVSTYLMQIPQIWGYVGETGAEVESARQIYTRARPLQICSCERRLKADSANVKETFQHHLLWSSVSCSHCKPVHHWQ